MGRITTRIQEALDERIAALRTAGFLDKRPPNRMRLLEAGRLLQAKIKQSSDPDPTWFQGLTWQAQAMKLQHAMEQATTQGSQAFARYMENLRKEAEGPKASKASRAIADDQRLNAAYHIAMHDDAENPKMGRVETLVREQVENRPDGRCIVFTHYRTTCEQVVQRLAQVEGLRPVMFVGQGKRRGQGGLTQKQQADTVRRFTDGEFNVLVATSVAEEGLDIPETDLVVFYEPIPSEIRSIQRRGRTGRKREGRVVVLMTKGTQDEAAHWSSRRREQQMVQQLQALRHTLHDRQAPQQTRLDAPAAVASPNSAPDEPASHATTAPPAEQRPATLFEGPRIVCDSREQPGQVVKHLSRLGAQIDTRTLDTADFILSDRIAVERKTGADFVDSLVDGRLFDQLTRLKEYPRPIIVLEGSLQGHRNVAPEALMGAFASVTVDYGIPVMNTADAVETARFLLAVAKREQGRAGRRVAVRPTTGAKDEQSIRIGVLASLPHVSERRAELLLSAFGSIHAVFTAAPEALAAVEGIGPKIAQDIHELITSETLSRAT